VQKRGAEPLFEAQNRAAHYALAHAKLGRGGCKPPCIRDRLKHLHFGQLVQHSSTSSISVIQKYDIIPESVLKYARSGCFRGADGGQDRTLDPEAAGDAAYLTGF
jgi:hypothetical protein